ncbi:HAD-IA family hydrolase [Salinibacterium sp. SWN1162]|uniref:HAD-IA family hydrolase n=1 Tax=Salinibacterium sp. SWN1162 TaxID=2792053 RepID=UPI0018CD7F50|nr:HAD-IA family hydrolase [Salinibacterium sp. SWN1162]MBH0010296.1 HAD-IA family hydrolase [Salinibacterium sp. SWN1162]
MTLLFIFDMDDVLYGYDWRARMAAMSDLTGLSFLELRRSWWHDDGEFGAEAGLYPTGEEYLAAFEEAIGQRVDLASWLAIRAAAMTPWPDSLAAARRAADLGQATLLTNNGALLGDHLSTVAPDLVEIFGDHLRTSSHYGARKPNPVVFERALEAYGVEPENAFFADDMPENVAAAESLGITGHEFLTGAAMHAAIEEFAAARS